MRRRRLLRGAIVIFVALLFAGSLLGIVLTGPIVVRVARISSQAVPSQVRLRADVGHLCGAFSPRDARDPATLQRAASWIADRLRDAGLEVTLQAYEVAGRTFENVVALRRGYDQSAGVWVIGAHYDAFPGLPGADDNASGVAALLELARSLPANQPRATQYFVAFSTGAPPRIGTEGMGSDVFARSLVSGGLRVGAMVSLDAVGYFSDAPDSQRPPIRGFPFVYPRRGNFVSVVGDLSSGATIERVKRGLMASRSIPVRSLRGPAGWVAVSGSDHTAFRALGLPAVRITDTSFLRNPHYHSAKDTAEQLDYERLARLVSALLTMLDD